jgi:hypothetical protein
LRNLFKDILSEDKFKECGEVIRSELKWIK